MSEWVSIYIILISNYITDYLQRSKETLLKDLLICTYEFSVIIKNLKASCECKMYKMII